MPEITVGKWTAYLNEKTNGFSCPICAHSEWETQATGNNVDSITVATSTIPEGAIEALFDGTKKAEDFTTTPTMADEVIAIRCGHCGYLAFFDRAFVEGKLHG